MVTRQFARLCQECSGLTASQAGNVLSFSAPCECCGNRRALSLIRREHWPVDALLHTWKRP